MKSQMVINKRINNCLQYIKTVRLIPAPDEQREINNLRFVQMKAARGLIVMGLINGPINFAFASTCSVEASYCLMGYAKPITEVPFLS